MFVIIIILLIVLIIVTYKLYLVLNFGINKCSQHLVGKVVIVTGGNSGMGYEIAKDLAYRGARVIIACEVSGKKARDEIITATNNSKIYYRHLDLSSLKSVRKFAEEFLKSETRLDILINNAGVIEPEHVLTEDGLLLGMQINYFGPFLLTNLLLPLLKASAPSRIINVSSMAYQHGDIDFENINKLRQANKTINAIKVYSTSKLYNVIMTVELSRILKDTRVTANTLHPGCVNTNIGDKICSKKDWFYKYFLRVFVPFLKTPWEGAQTAIFLAVSPEVTNISGSYFIDCKVTKTTQIVKDPIVGKKLWELSEKCVDL